MTSSPAARALDARLSWAATAAAPATAVLLRKSRREAPVSFVLLIREPPLL
jgi:hypothetical protein